MYSPRPSHTNRTPWRLVVFAIVLFGTLFPIGWLSTINPVAATIDELLFATDLSHAIAHGILFFAVGMGMLQVFPPLRNRPWRFLALMIVVGVVQEALQLVYKQRPIGFDEYRDLVTDATGYVVALLVVRRRANKVTRYQDNRVTG